MNSKPILIIGARGKTGKRVADRLEATGFAVRRASRSDTTRFDWEDETSWAPALQGVQSAYVTYYPDLATPAARGQIEALCATARAAGVEKLVLLSGRGETGAQACEDIVRRSGLDYTLIRAAWFAQNFSEGYMHAQVMEGVITLPAGTVREPIVDIDDIADVAFAALTDPRHARKEYDITGPRLLSFAEMAEILSRTLGRRVVYVPITLEQFQTGVTQMAGPVLAEVFTEVCRETLDGRNEVLGDGVQRALGRAPRDFADFCTATARHGVWHKPETKPAVSDKTPPAPRPRPSYTAMIILALTGLITLGIGGAIVASPVTFYTAYGVQLPQEVGLLNELSASGAGVAAIGLFLLLGAIPSRLTVAAAILGAMVNLAYLSARIMGYIFDDAPGHGFVMAGAAELVMGLGCLIAWRLASGARSES